METLVTALYETYRNQFYTGYFECYYLYLIFNLLLKLLNMLCFYVAQSHKRDLIRREKKSIILNASGLTARIRRLWPMNAT